ncbi:hypothetical protein GCM10009678_39560 [Actinomadura kijaniata]|uniref:Uncharacterized protein n=1 Tax=Actinomadura namibiensis TaxID=182080 RepID=A0A7W3LUD7_ACTNM|nr:hypothetical protein [Actinomadura namibiensis]MBA8954412.1 hypothetical protein [Actinomadura namibiensis]
MGYPGDRGRSGGAFPEPSSHEPRGTGQEFGNDAGGFGGGSDQQYGNDPHHDDRYGNDQYGDPGRTWSAEPPAEQAQPAPGSFGQGGGFGQESFGQGAPGQDAFGRDSFGAEQPAFGQGQFGQEQFGQEQFGQDRFGQQGSSFGPPPQGDPHASFGDGPGGPGGHGPLADEGGSKRGRNLPLVIGGAILAGAILAGIGAGAAGIFDPPKKSDPKGTAATGNGAKPKQPAASPSPTAPKLEPVKLQSRQTDPMPLTPGEVFAKAAFKGSGGVKYARTAVRATKGCAGTVTGAKLVAAVKKAGCTQTLRATYARGDGKLVGTVGVLNLKTENHAKYAQRAALAKDSFLQPLPGAGITKKIGTGEALGTAEVRGHYLVMTWVQRPDGKKIPATAHKLVSAFGQQMIKGSGLGFALAYRETEGKPFKK